MKSFFSHLFPSLNLSSSTSPSSSSSSSSSSPSPPWILIPAVVEYCCTSELLMNLIDGAIKINDDLMKNTQMKQSAEWAKQKENGDEKEKEKDNEKDKEKEEKAKDNNNPPNTINTQHTDNNHHSDPPTDSSTSSSTFPSPSPPSSSSSSPSSLHRYSLLDVTLYSHSIKSFDYQLEQFLSSHHSSAEHFVNLCQKIISSKVDGSQQLQSFIELLLDLTEFETFIQIIQNEEKRKYVKFILDSHRKYIKERNPK